MLLNESDRHWHTLREDILPSKAVGPVVHGARVSAICVDQGVHALWTTDRDFTRFPRLAVVNPLVDAG